MPPDPTLFPFDLPPEPSGSASRAKPRAESDKPRVEYESVSALTKRLRQTLERDFSVVRVGGEVSNWKPSASGHLYFSLKDSDAVLSCVVWRALAQRPDVQRSIRAVADGTAVQLTGKLAVYEPRGQYQLVVTDLRLAGVGDLYRRFLELKSKLAAEGLFDRAKKRPIPTFARRIGIVTSADAAALRDMINVARRRCSGVRMVVEHALVQGDEAPASLVAALARLAERARRGEIEVAIIARGGGSWEDLWPFQDEAVVRAVAAFPIPIVAGIGHEVDWSLCDEAADLRAPTPSAAAETCVPNLEERRQRLDAMHRRLQRLAQSHMDRARLRLESLRRHPAFQDPLFTVNRQRQRLDEWRARAADALQHRHLSAARRIQNATTRLDRLGSTLTSKVRVRFERMASRLAALNPRALLTRGYAMVSRATPRGLDWVTSARETRHGQELTLHFHDGAVPVKVAPKSRTPTRADEEQGELPL